MVADVLPRRLFLSTAATQSFSRSFWPVPGYPFYYSDDDDGGYNN